MPKSIHTLCGLLVASLFLVGCGGGADEDKAQPVKKGAGVEKHSEPDAPHGGQILHGMAGKKHVNEHLEFVFDEKTKESTLYVVVEKEGKFEPHGLEVEELELHIQPEDSDEETELVFLVDADAEPKGSKFVLPADKLPAGIEDKHDFEGHVHIDIDGTDTKFEMGHEGGDGHDH